MPVVGSAIVLPARPPTCLLLAAVACAVWRTRRDTPVATARGRAGTAYTAYMTIEYGEQQPDPLLIFSDFV